MMMNNMISALLIIAIAVPVMLKANIIQHPASVNVTLNSRVNFTCQGTGNTINFYVNGIIATDATVISKEFEQNMEPSNSTKICSLTAIANERNNNTIITCVINTSSQLSITSTPAVFLIQGILDGVGDLTATVMDGSNVLLTWTPPYTLDNVPITGYNIITSDGINITVNTTEFIFEYSYNITTASVAALNDVGVGKYSNICFYIINGTVYVITPVYPQPSNVATLAVTIAVAVILIASMIIATTIMALIIPQTQVTSNSSNNHNITNGGNFQQKISAEECSLPNRTTNKSPIIVNKKNNVDQNWDQLKSSANESYIGDRQLDIYYKTENTMSTMKELSVETQTETTTINNVDLKNQFELATLLESAVKDKSTGLVPSLKEITSGKITILTKGIGQENNEKVKLSITARSNFDNDVNEVRNDGEFSKQPSNENSKEKSIISSKDGEQEEEESLQKNKAANKRPSFGVKVIMLDPDQLKKIHEKQVNRRSSILPSSGDHSTTSGSIYLPEETHS